MRYLITILLIFVAVCAYAQPTTPVYVQATVIRLDGQTIDVLDTTVVDDHTHIPSSGALIKAITGLIDSVSYVNDTMKFFHLYNGEIDTFEVASTWLKPSLIANDVIIPTTNDLRFGSGTDTMRLSVNSLEYESPTAYSTIFEGYGYFYGGSGDHEIEFNTGLYPRLDLRDANGQEINLYASDGLTVLSMLDASANEVSITPTALYGPNLTYARLNNIYIDVDFDTTGTQGYVLAHAPDGQFRPIDPNTLVAGDNLGNHTMTQNLQTGGFNITDGTTSIDFDGTNNIVFNANGIEVAEAADDGFLVVHDLFVDNSLSAQVITGLDVTTVDVGALGVSASFFDQSVGSTTAIALTDEATISRNIGGVTQELEISPAGNYFKRAGANVMGVNLNATEIKLGTSILDADQTLNAGTDNYVLTYSNGTGLSSYQAIPNQISGTQYSIPYFNTTSSLSASPLTWDGTTHTMSITDGTYFNYVEHTADQVNWAVLNTVSGDESTFNITPIAVAIGAPERMLFNTDSLRIRYPGGMSQFKVQNYDWYINQDTTGLDGYVSTFNSSTGKIELTDPGTLAVTGDNLGNHTMTQILNTGGFALSGDGDNEGIYINSDGKVGIGTTPTASIALDVSGISRGSQLRTSTSGNLASVALQLNDSNTGLARLNTDQVDVVTGGTLAATFEADQDLTLAANLNLPATTSTTGSIKIGSATLLHAYDPPFNGTVDPVGQNIFIGTANYTMGSTATATAHSSQNVGIGFSVGGNLTTAYRNTLIGFNAGGLTTTGNNNSFIGYSAGLYNTTGGANMALGSNALGRNGTGSNNTAIGSNAAFYIADGVTLLTTVNNSTYIGNDTRASANSVTNETAIGYQAIGLASNTMQFGNSSIDSVGFGTAIFDVSGTPTNGQVFAYNSATNHYENSDISSITDNVSGGNGSIQFASSGVHASDPALYWDEASNFLGVGTNSPNAVVSIEHPTTPSIQFTRASGMTNTYTSVGFTPTPETGTIGHMSRWSTGGMAFSGFAGGSGEPGVSFLGYTKDTPSAPALHFGAFKPNGTGRTALTGTEKVFQFQTGIDVTWNTAIMTGLANGNVGIGTTSPVEKVDVVGNVRSNRFYGGVSGDASNPVFVRSSDLNTGIYFPADDNLAISTGGVGRLQIDASGGVIIANLSTNGSGQLVIGDSDSQGVLTVKRTAGQNAIVLDGVNGVIKGPAYVTNVPYDYSSANNTQVVAHPTIGNFRWKFGAYNNQTEVNAGATVMSLDRDSTLKVGDISFYGGIDTTGKNGWLYSLNTITDQMEFINPSGFGDNLGNHTATQNIQLNGNWLSNDGGDEGISIDNAGNVGIGTTSPAYPLDVTADTIRLGNHKFDLSTVPTNGQTWVWNNLTEHWEPGSAGGGATNLTFTGASSPITLNSDTGTDVTFTAGTGISLSQAGNNLTIASTVSNTNIYSTNGTLSGNRTANMNGNDLYWLTGNGTFYITDAGFSNLSSWGDTGYYMGYSAGSAFSTVTGGIASDEGFWQHQASGATSGSDIENTMDPTDGELGFSVEVDVNGTDADDVNFYVGEWTDGTSDLTGIMLSNTGGLSPKLNSAYLYMHYNVLDTTLNLFDSGLIFSYDQVPSTTSGVISYLEWEGDGTSANPVMSTKSKAFMRVSGGSTSFTNGVPERIDNDTPGTTTDVSSTADWTVTASSMTYTGTETRDFKITATLSCSTASAAEMRYYIAEEGTIISASERRTSHASASLNRSVTLMWIVSAATNDTYEIFVDAVASETVTLGNLQVSVEPW